MKLTISESRLKEIIEEELKNVIHKEGEMNFDKKYLK